MARGSLLSACFLRPVGRIVAECRDIPWSARIGPVIAALVFAATAGVRSQDPPPQFGGAYAGLDPRRQHLVDNWVGRFAKVTGRQATAAQFYDDSLSLSTKTTFEAVTHALMTTRLTDRVGAALGDALSLIEEVDRARGEIRGAPSDRQFRLYVRLTATAIGTLDRSQQFKRGADNAVYHQGYPINYRAQGGIPSIQISIALDRRHADIDVDYRSAIFPVALFNGHLTSSNSDVRSGDNYDRHLGRWIGFQNWWGGFFGIRPKSTQLDAEATSTMPAVFVEVPRAGKKTIDLMVLDFLTAWLIEGDIAAATGYISERSLACLARDSDDPATFDLGVAPFALIANLKAAHDAVAPRASLDGLVVGTRLVRPGLRVVRQAHHAQFVIYSVPDDIAPSLDCGSQVTPGDARRIPRTYGNYFGTTFYVDGNRATSVALLWARDKDYWKIVSWKVESDDTEEPPPAPAAAPRIVRVAADPRFVASAKAFLDNWLVRHDYDAAFRSISPKAYGCYDLERNPASPASTSPDDAGRRLRAGLETAGKLTGAPRRLDEVIVAVPPVSDMTRVVNHPDDRTFTLASPPNAVGDAFECAARASAEPPPASEPPAYGEAFGTFVRFRTRSGEAPVLRLLWRLEPEGWRISSYGIELP